MSPLIKCQWFAYHFRFALREMRLICATLLRRYDIGLIPGQSHEMKVHVVPYFTSGKYLVAVKPRE